MNSPNGASAARVPRTMRATGFALLAAMVIALTGAGAAVAAGPPTATTAAASNVTSTTATLNATVFPNQNDTSYAFQYGTSTGYGSMTPTAGPVNGNAGKDVSANLTGLAPSTVYHFRVVATNTAGTSTGADQMFTTPAPGAVPPGANTVTITSSRTTLTFGQSTTISGQLNGSGNASVQVTLEENPYPYTGGFKSTAVSTTSATGTYSFVTKPARNTHYRVVAKASPTVTSPEKAIAVRVKVTFGMSDRTPAAGQHVRFFGTVLPAHDGRSVRIQRRTSTGSWKTVAHATLTAAAPLNGVARSRFSRRLHVNRSGTYRVRLTPADGDHATGTSSTRHARVH